VQHFDDYAEAVWRAQDEIPDAYEGIDQALENRIYLVDVVHIPRPVVCVNG
jgi:RNA-splicing ligase RtcB